MTYVISMTFDGWKMIFLNSIMTFHERGTTWDEFK